ncbi:hypothetical protein BJX61DRAFT_547696 [Aspergillus egyptiacus]|nr:hypothetical protein BJX61DRAFT_547696 [Aspergillus egyptiacus]
MGQSSSTQREQRHNNRTERVVSFQRNSSRNRNEDMNNGHNMEQAGEFDLQAEQGVASNDVQMSGQTDSPADTWQSRVTQPGDLSIPSTRMGSIQEEMGSQYEATQREYRSAILARLAARRQSTMSRLGSRILPNSVIRGLLNSEEETPAEGHAHRHGIVSRTIPRSEANQTSSRFSPFTSLSTRGSSRRRSMRGPYFIPRSDATMDSRASYPGSPSEPSAETSTEPAWGSWRRSVRLRRVGHSISNPIAQMFGQPSADMPADPSTDDSYQFHNPDPVGFIPHPGPMDTHMDFDTPHELDSMEPAIGNPRPSSPALPQATLPSPVPRHFPNLLRTRPSRAMRREEQTPLSRVLQLAAAAIAAQLSGGTGPALPNIHALGNDGLDGSLESFIQSLQRATSGQPSPGEPATATEDDAPRTPVNFMRVFRFANSDPPRQSGTSNPPTADAGNSTNAGEGVDTENHADSPEGRTVTLVVVGVRSVPSENGPVGEQPPAALPGLDALLRLPFLTPGSFSPRPATRPGATFSRPSQAGINGPITNDDVSRQSGFSSSSRRPSDTGSRGPPSSLPSVISDSPPGPHPPPSTPAEPGLSAVPSGASTPSRRLSTTSAIPPNILPQLNENGSMQPTVEPPEEGIPFHTHHQRRRSDSEFARHREQLGSGAARRNGVVEPDTHNPQAGRSWLIYVVGTNLSENHPAFAAPSLFTDNPTYEDMVLLSSLLGPAKPPVATQEELSSAGGLFRVVEHGGSLLAEPVDGADALRIAEGERCLICLSDYEAAEELRQLTKCRHLYHRECIDQWLTTGRNSCPLCRGQGVGEKPNAETSPDTQNAAAA